MPRFDRLQLTAAVVMVLLIVAFTLWVLDYAAEFDANPGRNSLKSQMMRRKSEAMEDLLDSVIRGRLNRVEDAANRLEKYSLTIKNFLETDAYQQHGANFYTSLEDLKISVNRNDREAAKEAILRLERSCIDCHFMVNPTN